MSKLYEERKKLKRAKDTEVSDNFLNTNLKNEKDAIVRQRSHALPTVGPQSTSLMKVNRYLLTDFTL
jgi:hypothetical protein